MPNYVYNQIEIQGDQKEIDDLLKNVASDKNYFDFEKIIPIPGSLKIDSGTISDRIYAIYLYENKIDEDPLKEYLSYSFIKNEGITTLEEVYDYFVKKVNYYNRDMCKQIHDNMEKYGSKDWYEWSCKNWGTKWNSSESDVIGNFITFQTACSTPSPIIEKLSIDYPNLEFIVKYADEDIGGSNCGTYIMKNGGVIFEEGGDIVFSCELWGYDPAEYESYRRDKTIDSIINKNDSDV